MILWRHPVTDAPPGLCYGRLDIGLGPGAEAEIAAACAAAPRLSLVLTSPAFRARRLALPLAEAAGAALRVEPRLAEIDFGAWEGRRWFAIDRAESDPWAEDPWTRSPPGGETFGALHARVGAVLAEAGAEVGLVTHAGPIRSALIRLRGLSFAEAFATKIPFAEAMDLRDG